MQKLLYFSGIQPTGKLHIGNYLGAIKNWVRLQSQGNNIYCIVDLHALTDKMKIDHEITFPTNTASDTIELAATLIASGINPISSIFFLQSKVPQHAELMWLLSCVAPQSWLNKMTQFKDKKTQHSTLGLYTYPVLMAADIILYQATHVPVGLDQKQHVELTHDYIGRINSLFKLNLIQPQYVESSAPKIMNLRNGMKKMSKSDTNDDTRINLNDTKELIQLKLMKAKTDSIEKIYYDQANRPEVSNLLRIYSALKGLTLQQIEELYHDKPIVQFKNDLAEIISSELNPIAQKAQELLQKPVLIQEILDEGSQRAEAIAKENLRRIKREMGLLI